MNNQNKTQKLISKEQPSSVQQSQQFSKETQKHYQISSSIEEIGGLHLDETTFQELKRKHSKYQNDFDFQRPSLKQQIQGQLQLSHESSSSSHDLINFVKKSTHPIANAAANFDKQLNSRNQIKNSLIQNNLKKSRASRQIHNTALKAAAASSTQNNITKSKESIAGSKDVQNLYNTMSINPNVYQLTQNSNDSHERQGTSKKKLKMIMSNQKIVQLQQQSSNPNILEMTNFSQFQGAGMPSLIQKNGAHGVFSPQEGRTQQKLMSTNKMQLNYQHQISRHQLQQQEIINRLNNNPTNMSSQLALYDNPQKQQHQLMSLTNQTHHRSSSQFFTLQTAQQGNNNIAQQKELSELYKDNILGAQQQQSKKNLNPFSNQNSGQQSTLGGNGGGVGNILRTTSQDQLFEIQLQQKEQNQSGHDTQSPLSGGARNMTILTNQDGGLQSPDELNGNSPQNEYFLSINLNNNPPKFKENATQSSMIPSNPKNNSVIRHKKNSTTIGPSHPQNHSTHKKLKQQTSNEVLPPNYDSAQQALVTQQNPDYKKQVQDKNIEQLSKLLLTSTLPLQQIKDSLNPAMQKKDQSGSKKNSLAHENSSMQRKSTRKLIGGNKTSYTSKAQVVDGDETEEAVAKGDEKGKKDDEKQGGKKKNTQGQHHKYGKVVTGSSYISGVTQVGAKYVGGPLGPPPTVKQKNICINLSKCQYEVLRDVCKNDFSWKISNNDNFNGEWDIFWQDTGQDIADKLTHMKPYQKINHFPGTYLIARKTFLAKNLKKIQKLMPEEYDFFPKTWVIPNEINDLRYCFNSNQEKFKGNETISQASQAIAVSNLKETILDSKKPSNSTNPNNQASTSAKPKKNPKPGNSFTDKKNSMTNKDPVPKHQVYTNPSNLLLIVKPDQLSQGKGIFLTRNLDDINLNEKLVVQEYMTQPYLIDNLKFDIRLYVLILNLDPMKIFLYDEGLARFATEEYKKNINETNIGNMYVHLTNYSLNKENVGKYNQAKDINDTTSHKRSWKGVLQRLKADGQDIEKVQLDIQQIIVKTMLSIHPDMVHKYRTCQPADREYSMCFELLGFDVILDKDCQPKILEVNHAPSFATESPLDQEIKRQLIHDTFKLVNYTLSEKQEKMMNIYEEKQNRIMHKTTLKQKQNQQNQSLLHKLAMKDQYENENCGSFTKIFPLDIKYPEYIDSIDDLKERQKIINDYQYQTMLMARYSDILYTVQNYETEKQLKKFEKTAEQLMKQKNALDILNNMNFTYTQNFSRARLNTLNQTGQSNFPSQQLSSNQAISSLQQPTTANGMIYLNNHTTKPLSQSPLAINHSNQLSTNLNPNAMPTLSPKQNQYYHHLLQQQAQHQQVSQNTYTSNTLANLQSNNYHYVLAQAQMLKQNKKIFNPLNQASQTLSELQSNPQVQGHSQAFFLNWLKNLNEVQGSHPGKQNGGQGASSSQQNQYSTLSKQISGLEQAQRKLENYSVEEQQKQQFQEYYKKHPTLKMDKRYSNQDVTKVSPSCKQLQISQYPQSKTIQQQQSTTQVSQQSNQVKSQFAVNMEQQLIQETQQQQMINQNLMSLNNNSRLLSDNFETLKKLHQLSNTTLDFQTYYKQMLQQMQQQNMIDLKANIQSPNSKGSSKGKLNGLQFLQAETQGSQSNQKQSKQEKSSSNNKVSSMQSKGISLKSQYIKHSDAQDQADQQVGSPINLKDIQIKHQQANSSIPVSDVGSNQQFSGTKQKSHSKQQPTQQVTSYMLNQTQQVWQPSAHKLSSVNQNNQSTTPQSIQHQKNIKLPASSTNPSQYYTTSNQTQPPAMNSRSSKTNLLPEIANSYQSQTKPSEDIQQDRKQGSKQNTQRSSLKEQTNVNSVSAQHQKNKIKQQQMKQTLELYQQQKREQIYKDQQQSLQKHDIVNNTKIDKVQRQALFENLFLNESQNNSQQVQAQLAMQYNGKNAKQKNAMQAQHNENTSLNQFLMNTPQPNSMLPSHIDPLRSNNQTSNELMNTRYVSIRKNQPHPNHQQNYQNVKIHRLNNKEKLKTQRELKIQQATNQSGYTGITSLTSSFGGQPAIKNTHYSLQNNKIKGPQNNITDELIHHLDQTLLHSNQPPQALQNSSTPLKSTFSITNNKTPLQQQLPFQPQQSKFQGTAVKSNNVITSSNAQQSQPQSQQQQAGYSTILHAGNNTQVGASTGKNQQQQSVVIQMDPKRKEFHNMLKNLKMQSSTHEK